MCLECWSAREPRPDDTWLDLTPDMVAEIDAYERRQQRRPYN